MIEPFLKWAGGKRWLTSSGGLPAPQHFDRYVEPFLGGGAVFFKLQPEVALLSDINGELIDLYRVVRDAPDALRERLEGHQARHCPEHYYATRAVVPDSLVERAARTLYLNRTCWNGLYRVNRKGEFNVPIGTKTAVVLEADDFLSIARNLQNADIRQCDFEETISQTVAGDFLFVDPPYTVRHNMNGFVKYNEKIFTWLDQVRLYAAVTAAAARGVSVVVTNADHESLRELYAGNFIYRRLSRSSVLSGLATGRGPTTEAMFIANL
ncbi:DNA adenine methylase [Sphingomonas sanxanigenens]|uniref:DNA adenine methylase n=1 Tax=Sphingomonas sanxanigenens TaxID=397260 RepID=UPI0009FF5E9C|nr:Dam family site-specific DNA-(adenine-N6)-methyltransferase [Sphingomonas sanxanigenens]